MAVKLVPLLAVHEATLFDVRKNVRFGRRGKQKAPLFAHDVPDVCKKRRLPSDG